MPPSDHPKGAKPRAHEGDRAQEDPRAPRSGARGAVTLMVGTLFSRLTGLVRHSVMLALFPTVVTDAFLVAWRVPNLFRELLAEGALVNAFVPIYRSLPVAERRRLSGALFSLLFAVNAALTLLAVLAAPAVVGLLLRGEGNVDYALTVTLARIVFPFLGAISFAALAMGILNAEERFLAPAWAPVAFNVVIIALIALFPGRAALLALAFVLGGVAQLLWQLPALFRHGLFPALGWRWHGALSRVLSLALPFTFTTGARQLLNVVAIWVLNVLPPGSVTAFENANLFFMLALGLFGVSPALAFYSRLSADAAERPENVPATLLAGLRFIAFLTAPAGLALVVLAEPAVHTLFNWGPASDQGMVAASVVALVPLGLAVFPWGLNTLLIRPFYVRERIKAPILISVVFIALNTLLYFVLAPRYGVAGMSWGTALVGWLQLALLLGWMRQAEGLQLAAFLAYALKVWLAAVLAAGLAYAALQLLAWPPAWWGFVWQMGVGGALFCLGFAGAALALALPELTGLLARLRRQSALRKD